MTRNEYEQRLLSRLQEAVAEAEQERRGSAKQILTGSPEHNPDLYGIGMGSDLQHYPLHILQCDQMQMFLNQVDWNQDARAFKINQSELPSLQAICESLPS